MGEKGRRGEGGREGGKHSVVHLYVSLHTRTNTHTHTTTYIWGMQVVVRESGDQVCTACLFS